MQRIRVYAPAAEPPVQYRNERGEYVVGRFIARDAAGAPLPDGEEVLATLEVRRDLARGHLALVAVHAPEPAPPRAFARSASRASHPDQE
jgi:hypothetical protein